MITLVILLLFVLAVIYAVFFCVFKLIWIIFKKERNFWPLVLAGVGTLGIAVFVVGGTYVLYQKVTTPVKRMMADVRANPQMITGERTYKDEAYPFEMTVFDGMDFSDWITFDDVHLKGGIDTNVFKKGYDQKKPFLMAAIVRLPANEEDPFTSFITSMHNDKNAQYRMKITHESETEINGMRAYEMDAIFYSNRGPLDSKVAAILAPDHQMYYIGVLSVGENTLGKEGETMIHSFRFGPTALPNSAENTEIENTADAA